MEKEIDRFEMEKELDGIVEKYMEEGYFPSAVVKVFNNDRVYYEKAFGDVNTDTIYDMASLSKIVTSTMVLLLINQGKLKLHDKIGDIIPELSNYDGFTPRHLNITIRDLLIHKAGIIDWYPVYSEKGTFLEVLNKVIKKYDWVEETLYSDLNYMLLGEIIERVTGKGLEEALEEYLKKPLGIKNMYFNPKDKSNIAPGAYGNNIEEEMCEERNISFNNWRSREKKLVGEVNDGNSYYFFHGISGHAGIFSDLEAYSRLCNLYLRTQDELLIESMKEQGGGRGLGWQIADVFPHGCGHTGFTGTSVWVSKEKNISALIFTNRLMGSIGRPDLRIFRTEIHDCITKFF